jgi:tRNA threonylcarbamoyladenosine biosynthesis protein TsaB
MILGFDTSGPYCGGALWAGGEIIAAKHEDLAKGQAERLMVMLEEILAQAGVAWCDLEALGVGIGPGNFTGIRISVAAARGLAMGLGIPAVGVPLPEAAAEGTEGSVLACLDARREMAYCQGFGGAAPDALTYLPIAEIPSAWAQPGLVCIGSAAEAVSAHLSVPHAPAAFAPAAAIARIAARRASPDTPPPSPLYMRAPDAAPSKLRGPVMLP